MTTQTPLNNQFTFWLTFFNKSKDKQLEEFEDNLKPLGTFSTAEDFWNIYQHMKRPYRLPRGSEFFLFKAGIKPLWEDTKNIGGGRFYISVKRSVLSNKIWEDLLLAFVLIQNNLPLINGVVLNVRSSETFLSVWTAPIKESEMGEYRKWIKESLDLPIEQIIDYKKHPNNAQLIQKQEKLTLEEEERKKREIEFEKKKEEDMEKKKKYLEEKESKEKAEGDDIRKLANLIEMDNKEAFEEPSEFKNYGKDEHEDL